MTILTVATPHPTTSQAQTSQTHAASAPADATGPADGGDGGFANLLGAGIGRATAPAPADEPEELKKDPKTTVNADTPAYDPAALLEAIAAGRANLAAQQPAAAQIAPQALPATFAPADFAAQTAVAASAALPVSASGSTLSARIRTESGKGMPQDDAQGTAGSPHAPRVHPQADVGPAPAAGIAAAREPAGAPPFKAELSERMQDPVSQLPAAGGPLAHALPTSRPANPASVLVHVEQLAQPFGSPAWNEGLSSRVVWMVKNDVQSAAIHLNPPNLGPIEVKIVLSSDAGMQSSASVQFSAAHAATREAIESAMPRLREMLMDNGIALGNTSVDARTAGNTGGSGDSGRPSPGSAQADTRDAENPEPALQPRISTILHSGNGLVDTFA